MYYPIYNSKYKRIELYKESIDPLGNSFFKKEGEIRGQLAIQYIEFLYKQIEELGGEVKGERWQ